MFGFRKNYLWASLSLLVIEIFIALFVHDRIIRPYVGDFLVVILLYCLARTFWQAPVITVAIAVLLFAYLIELLQYFRLVRLLGLENSRLANVVIGNRFEWIDLIAYTLGILAVWGIERFRLGKKKNTV